MKIILFLCLAFSPRCFSLPVDEDRLVSWEEYKVAFDKKYDIDEERLRENVFDQNLLRIQQHNAGGSSSFRLGVNKFTDWTHEEYVQFLRKSSIAIIPAPKDRRGDDVIAETQNGVRLPDSVDWRLKNAVIPPKNQGEVGQVGIYAAVGSLESHHAIKTGNLVSLSELNVQQCCGFNCSIDVTATFEYVRTNGGIDIEGKFPCSSQGCGFCEENVGATCSGYVTLPSGDELKMQETLANDGPVAVYVDASSLQFQMYSGGIYDNPDCSTTLLDHAMVIVGYGIEGGNEFWLAKNSWGAFWGEEGYIKMARNKKNQCGIATSSSIPLV